MKHTEIDQKELRVGNILEYFLGEEEQWIDCVIDAQDIYNCAEHWTEFSKHHRRIHLSEEWLIRAGAESSVFDNRKQYFLRKFGRLIIYQDGQFHEYATRVKLPFVHTLQNFIFVISDGEELTFKDIDQ